MILIRDTWYVDRKEAARILEVSMRTLEVWKSFKSHPSLHKSFFKLKGRTCYYKLSEVEGFLKQWNQVRYEEYCNSGDGDISTEDMERP